MKQDEKTSQEIWRSSKVYQKKKNERNFAICNNMDRTGGYVSYLVEQSKTNTVCFHLYVECKKIK